MWKDIANMVTALGFFVVSVSALVALSQLRELVKTRHLEAMIWVYELIGDQSAREARLFIYNNLRSEPSALKDNEREKVEFVCVRLDRVAKLINMGVIPKEEITDDHGHIFIGVWQRVEQYVYEIRKKAGKQWVRNFENLAAELMSS